MIVESWGFVVLKLKLSLPYHKILSLSIAISTSVPPPVPSHYVPVYIQLLDQYTGLKLCVDFKEKSQPEYKFNLSDLC